MQLPKELKKFKYEVIEAEKNGHCFIEAIHFCLEHDHGMIFMEEDIKRLITYEVFQNNNYYSTFYDGSILCMLWALDRYIFKGVFTHQVVDIAILAAGTILHVNMCIYKNENGKAILYSQPTNPPSKCDVYLCYSNEHYDSICSMKSSEECNGSITFNITQDDVNAFVAIGASFYVSDPMDVVNRGKLYFVPPKNFSSIDSPFAQPQHTTVDVNNPTSGQDCSMFVPNAETLGNNVWDFNTDIQLAETEYEEGEEDPNEDEVYDMFANLDLSQNVQDQFHFAEHYSCDEDTVLDNSGDEQENVTPLKPWPKKKVQIVKIDGIKSIVRKELNPPTSLSPHDIHIDLTNSNIQPSHMNKLMPETSRHTVDTEIDLTGKPKKFRQPKNSNVLINHTASTSNASQQLLTYDSEPLSSDNTSFMSDSSLSTSCHKPRKFEKVKIDEERMR